MRMVNIPVIKCCLQWDLKVSDSEAILWFNLNFLGLMEAEMNDAFELFILWCCYLPFWFNITYLSVFRSDWYHRMTHKDNFCTVVSVLFLPSPWYTQSTFCPEAITSPQYMWRDFLTGTSSKNCGNSQQGLPERSTSYCLAKVWKDS